MNRVLNPKPLSEIQAMRKLEEAGDIKEQMGRVLALMESGRVSTDEMFVETVKMMAEIMSVFEQTTMELTTLIAMGGGV